METKTIRIENKDENENGNRGYNRYPVEIVINQFELKRISIKHNVSMPRVAQIKYTFILFS